ncbi:uncharacterized protein LOC114310236 [Camellia sinensis]|uniref:uncharacterized protein LOC114310236 n=1 Tax=Camellia sinensis TaxID=4442 RepID=UPI001035B9E0|nr:uncharacterized protein LOC114310236 [Camellia sinensis]
MNNSVLPEVIVIDKELAFMNAIDNTFPNARHLLCRWHINRNVLTKCKKMFETKEKWDKFNTAWNYLILSLTEDGYNDHLATLHKDFSNYSEVIKYVTHIQVKASFEKSLTTVQHQFKPSQFRELRGNVAICALEYMLAKSKRANSAGINVAACGCVLRCTHSLLCAHEIADYMRQGRPIPLSSIHVHWTRLTICVHNPKIEKLELTCIPELETILKRFKEPDIATQLDMLKKLRKIANPASTFLIEPDVKPNPRPGHKKIDISCRRDPCAFELVDNGHDNQSTLASNGDGNCGFRAIASLLGLRQNAWVQVMCDLLLELNNRTDEYVCLTFLPLRSPPVTLADRCEIAIGFVNGNHFVFLEAGHPVPSIVVLWRVHHHPCASKWENAYVSHIKKFKDNIRPNVATPETFDVVDID